MSRANRSAKDRLPNAILFLLLRSCSFIDSPSLFQSNLARLNVRLSMTRVWSSCGSRWSRLARADDLRATNFATNTNERIIIFFSSMNFCLWKTKRRFVDLNLGFTRVHSPSFVLVCLVWIQLHDPRNDLDSLVFETHLDSLLIFFFTCEKSSKHDEIDFDFTIVRSRLRHPPGLIGHGIFSRILRRSCDQYKCVPAQLVYEKKKARPGFAVSAPPGVPL